MTECRNNVDLTLGPGVDVTIGSGIDLTISPMPADAGKVAVVVQVPVPVGAGGVENLGSLLASAIGKVLIGEPVPAEQEAPVEPVTEPVPAEQEAPVEQETLVERVEEVLEEAKEKIEDVLKIEPEAPSDVDIAP